MGGRKEEASNLWDTILPEIARTAKAMVEPRQRTGSDRMTNALRGAAQTRPGIFPTCASWSPNANEDSEMSVGVQKAGDTMNQNNK